MVETACVHKEVAIEDSECLLYIKDSQMMYDKLEGIKPKRILQVNKLYYPTIGGIERVVQQIAEGLSEQNEMSVLVCSNDIHYKQERISGVHIVRMPKLFQLGSLPIPLGMVWKMRKMSKQMDIIHLHMPFPIGDLACLLSGFKGKIIVSWHSDVVRQKKMMRIYKPLMLQMLKRTDVIVVATQGNINGSEYLGEFREKCVVIPYGTEKKVEEAADAYYRKKNQVIKNNIVQFLFVGRLVYYKGCDVLLHAFSKVQGAELVIVGSGTLEAECQKLLKDYGMEDRVTLCGTISEEELYEQFEQCDVFVLPSVVKSEAFGLVQIEAMSFGKPVINTNLPSGVPYVSLHGETGLTVPPLDVDALAKAMQWLIDHEEERNQMGQKARERMKAEFSVSQMLTRLQKIYET